ncbi:hypothetical protein Pcac1_g21816 [Phytophthora cactorum]|nr:hypothetical protein Pcac1_g21816 [Phytophthora cactorum]
MVRLPQVWTPPPPPPPKGVTRHRHPLTPGKTRAASTGGGADSAPNGPTVKAEIGEGGDVVTTPSDAPSPPILEPARPAPSPPPIQPDEVGTASRSYAAALLRTPALADRPGLDLPSILHLKPSSVAGLLDKLPRTLDKGWDNPATPDLDEDMAKLRELAEQPSLVHADSTLREPTATETAALMDDLNGDLELMHPPNFLKATMTVLQRAMMEQFREKHIKVTLTADVPPQVPLRRNVTHVVLFTELFCNGPTLCPLLRLTR